MRKQNRAFVCAAAVAAVAAMSATRLSAAEVYWRGGPGNLTATNYTTDGSDTIPFTPGDIVNLGAHITTSDPNNSIVVTTSINYGNVPPNAPTSVRVGHNFGTLPGPASLFIRSGGLVVLGNAAAANDFDKAALIVGYNADGTFTVGDNNNAAGNTHMDGLTIVGAKTDDAFAGIGTGTLNVNRSNFRVRISDFIIGYGNRGVLNHGTGAMMVGMDNRAGTTGAYNMYLGYTTASEWNKTSRGVCDIGNSLFIGSGSVANLAAGVITTKKKSGALEGDVVVGRNGSVNDQLNITYNGTPTAGTDIGPTQLNVGNRFLLASGGGGATTSTVNQSAGTVNVALDLSVSDTDNTSNATYNLSGGALNANSGLSRIGRRGNGQMIQTGGTATFNAGLAVGDDDSTEAGETDNATGLYEISAGTLTTNVASGHALRVGSAGNGTFRVVGQGGVVSVNGGMLVGNTSDGVGTLAYRTEAGESLTTVKVSGTATFNAGSVLQLDVAGKPTQALFTVVDAIDIVNNGLVPSVAGGWNFLITPGGTGKLLKFFAGDFNADGRINADDYALIDRGAAMQLTGGVNGDLNADGAINSEDYLLIDSAYAQLGAPLSPGFLAQREVQFGPGYVSELMAAVPEPAAAFAIAGLPLTRRRRR